jgi:ParB family chromosome partitioning protein
MAGQAIVELDSDLLDPSPIADRLDGQDVTELLASIQLSGQQVPILVRPHPETPGRFQIAYGHRRAKALAEIGKPVKAVVRQLSDGELVVAQGQENNARRDLSYIERALYAARLEAAGYERETLMSALAIDKTQLSKLISSVAKIPTDIIEAIGAAPSFGRNRWIALAQKFDSENKVVSAARLAIAASGFREATSDQRFELVEKALQQPRPERPKIGPIISASGQKVGRVSQTGRDLKISIDKKFDVAFAEYLISQLPILADKFSKAGREDT